MKINRFCDMKTNRVFLFPEGIEVVTQHDDGVWIASIEELELDLASDDEEAAVASLLQDFVDYYDQIVSGRIPPTDLTKKLLSIPLTVEDWFNE